MTQVHKRFSDEQVGVLFQGYLQGYLSRADVENMLEIVKTPKHFRSPING